MTPSPGIAFSVTEGLLLEKDTGGLELTERSTFGHEGSTFASLVKTGETSQEKGH